ncbi:hypothetical protein M2347_003684 [Chryseobacterium sp. H1D6B]|uniref:T9SS-dependent choice-of-anchor J family protein n=1 Tax=Chryseobacterium sp. H1D6B TaxID=2940588 RepID=UPI0015CCD9DD|nr:choice-of-anchor J domain-containing protein [Chryseobacterium sp. H1D6B]MDH6253957.1 hypothetical protein [Chryseobacterium sp. H1D6B]
MRKKLFLSTMLGAVLQVNAQTTIFNETFEAGSSTANTWTVQDLDGDGNNWILDDQINTSTDPMGFSGNVFTSVSFFSTPDNLLSSPAVNLPAGGGLSLSFQVGVFSSLNPAEHYAVYVLPVNAVFTGSETPVFEETFTVGEAGTAVTRTVDISAFSGQDIKVYFRHYNTNSQFIIILDNVKVTQNTLGTLEAGSAAAGIYPNPASDYIYLNTHDAIKKAEIFDMAGRKVNVNVNGRQINIQHLQPGIYLIHITAGNKTYSQKFIKK